MMIPCLMFLSFWIGSQIHVISDPILQSTVILASLPCNIPPQNQIKPFNISDIAEIDRFVASQSGNVIMDIPKSTSAQIYHDYFNMFCNGCDFGPIWFMTHSLCAHHLNFSMFIVGANYGDSITNVLRSCAEVTPRGEPMINPSIYAFEAVPEIFQKLKDTMFMVIFQTLPRFPNSSNLRLFQNAVSDINGSSVEVHSDLGGGGGLHSEYKSKEMTSRGFVDTVTFDWVLHDVHSNEVVDYVLIDVEGFEVNVVRGMNLEQNVHKFPMFQVELGGTWVDGRHSTDWTQGDLAEYLENLGYDLFLLGGDKSWNQHIDKKYGFDVRGNPKMLRVYSEMWRNGGTLRCSSGSCHNGSQYVQGNLLAVNLKFVRMEIRDVMASILRQLQMETFNHMKFVGFRQPGVST